VGLAYAFLVKKPLQLGKRRIDLSMLAHLRVRDDNPKEVLTNVLAGRTQLGKTDALAACLYLFAIGLGVVSIGLVRTAGGD